MKYRSWAYIYLAFPLFMERREKIPLLLSEFRGVAWRQRGDILEEKGLQLLPLKPLADFQAVKREKPCKKQHLFKVRLCVLVAQLCLTFCDPMDCSLSGSSVHGIFLGNSTGVDCHFLLQGIFPTKESNSGLLHCRQILYSLSHWGSHQGK